MTAHFDRALMLFRQRRFDQAEKEIAQELAADPDHPLAHAVLALCLAQRKQFEAATRHARTAVGLAPDVPFTHATLSRIYFARGHLDEAAVTAGEAISLGPGEPDHFVLQGQIEFARERWQQALQSADRALALDAEHVDALNLRAEALRKLGRAGTAEAQLLAALAVDPDEAQTHASLGWVYLEKGDRPKAMQHFREALRLDAELESAREGVVATLRAHNPAYRIFLKYMFWMQKLGRRGQWVVILVAWLAYVFARQAARDNPALGKILWPVIAAYLLFVLGTWLANPLANLALRLHPFGRLALSPDERMGSNFIGLFLLGLIVSAAVYLYVGGAVFGRLAVFFGLMLLPLGATFQAAAPWPRKPLIVYTLGIGALGLVLVVAPLTAGSIDAWPLPLALAWVLLCRAAPLLFPLGAVLSLFAGNVLMSIRWKQ